MVEQIQVNLHMIKIVYLSLYAYILIYFRFITLLAPKYVQTFWKWNRNSLSNIFVGDFFISSKGFNALLFCKNLLIAKLFYFFPFTFVKVYFSSWYRMIYLNWPEDPSPSLNNLKDDLSPSLNNLKDDLSPSLNDSKDDPSPSLNNL